MVDIERKEKFRLVAMVFGLILLLYPLFSDYSMYKKQLREVEEIKSSMSSVGGSREEDSSVLDVHAAENQAIAILTVPKINLEVPIYEGNSNYDIGEDIELVYGTDLPDMGVGHHSVISGHSGMSLSRLFTKVPQLEVGDEFFLNYNGKTIRYKIYESKKVLPTEVEAMDRIKDKEVVSLMTCVPISINTHRLFLYGEKVEEYDLDDSSLSSGSFIGGFIADNKIYSAIVLVAFVFVGKDIFGSFKNKNE